MSTLTDIQSRARELLARAGPAEPLSPEELQAVWQKTAPALAAGAGWVWLKWLVLALAVAVPVALVGARGRQTEAVSLPPPPVEPSPRVELPPEVVEPAAVPEQAPLPPRPIVQTAPRAVAVAAPPVAPLDPLLAESRLLARAVAELRERHDAEASLALLDEHALKFPRGVLRQEAALTRVEALVAASRRADARVLLESLDLQALPRGGELEVLLGELLQETGRGAEAHQRFSRALATELRADVAERAAWGAADTASATEATAALERYLARFPDGRFSAQARARLGVE